MAKYTKRDVSGLYGRAANLSQQAMEMDGWADQLRQDGIQARSTAHREIARLMREEAQACRELADREWPGD